MGRERTAEEALTCFSKPSQGAPCAPERIGIPECRDKTNGRAAPYQAASADCVFTLYGKQSGLFHLRLHVISTLTKAHTQIVTEFVIKLIVL